MNMLASSLTLAGIPVPEVVFYLGSCSLVSVPREAHLCSLYPLWHGIPSLGYLVLRLIESCVVAFETFYGSSWKIWKTHTQLPGTQAVLTKNKIFKWDPSPQRRKVPLDTQGQLDPNKPAAYKNLSFLLGIFFFFYPRKKNQNIGFTIWTSSTIKEIKSEFLSYLFKAFLRSSC